MKGRYGGYPLFLPIFQSLRNFAETLVKNKIIKYSANFSLQESYESCLLHYLKQNTGNFAKYKIWIICIKLLSLCLSSVRLVNPILKTVLWFSPNTEYSMLSQLDKIKCKSWFIIYFFIFSNYINFFLYLSKEKNDRNKL